MPTQTAELMHDLRMPLQVIYSCAQLLEEEVGGNARARGYVQALLSGAAEMQQMLAGALERGAVTYLCDEAHAAELAAVAPGTPGVPSVGSTSVTVWLPMGLPSLSYVVSQCCCPWRPA